MIPQASNDCWFYAKDKKKVGPVSLARLRELLADGMVTATDMVLQEGMQKWRPLAEVAATMPGGKHPSNPWKRTRTIGAAAGAAMIFLTFLCCGLVALLSWLNQAADTNDSRPVAEIARASSQPEKTETAGKKGSQPDGEKDPSRVNPQGLESKSPKVELNPGRSALEVPKQNVALAVQLGHTPQGAITSVAFSPDGRQIVTGSRDYTARLWDVASGREIRAFQGHTATVTSVAFSPDGNQVLTSSYDETVRIWSATTGTQISVFKVLCHSAVFSPDGKQLLTAGRQVLARADSTVVRLWDAVSGKEIRAFQKSSSGVFSADGKQILTAGMWVQWWDAASGKEIRALGPAGGPVVFSPDGKQVLTGGVKSLELWDAASGKKTLTLTFGQKDIGIVKATSVAFSQDGKRVIATIGPTGELWDFVAVVWDVASGKQIRTLVDGTGYRRTRGPIKLDPVPDLSVAFSPDGTQVLMPRGPNTVVLWDVATGKEIRIFEGNTGAAIDLAFTPDGKHLITKTRHGIAVWNMAQAKLIRDFKGLWNLAKGNTPNLNPGHRMAVSPDLKQVAILDVSQVNFRHTVRLGDAATGKEIRAFEVDSPSIKGSTERNPWDLAVAEGGSQMLKPVSYLAFSPDGTQVLTWCSKTRGDNIMGLWDATTGKKIRLMLFHPRPTDQSVKSVAFSPDGTQFLTGGLVPFKVSNMVMTSEGDAPKKIAVAFSDVLLWDVASGTAKRVFRSKVSGPEPAYVTSVSFSPAGKLVLAYLSDRKMRIFEAATSKLICILQPVQKDNRKWLAAEPFAFSPDGKQVFTWNFGDQAGRLWDSATGKEIRAFQGYAGIVDSVAFSPDGKQVATACSDGTVRLWDATSGRELCRLMSFLDGSWAATTPDNYYMASKGNLNGVAFSLGKRSFAFDQFDLRFNRPDKVLESLGNTSREMVASYQRAYQKRLKKLNFTEEMLSDDFHVPDVGVKSGAEHTTRVSTLKLKVQASDSKYLLDRLHVDVNGVPLHGTGGISLRKEQSKTWAQEIEVELSTGKNKIDVSVLNEKGAESLKETISINYDAPPTKPNLYVVAVGVSDYVDARLRLTYADKDARDLADLFEGKRDRFGEVKVQRILNRDATRENILKAKDFLKTSRVDDLVVVFFAGHGLLDSKLDYYFATADIDFKNPAKRGLPYEAIEDLLDGIGARKKLLLMDTCHSGELDKEEVQVVQSEKKSGDEVKIRTFRGLDFEVSSKVGLNNSYQLLQEMFADLRRGTGAIVISSAGGAEFAMESATWKNGVFTHALIRGLKGEANRDKNGRVQVSELRDFVEREVRRLTNGRQVPTARRENLVVDFTLD